MWTQVSARHHYIARVFGPSDGELMLYGNVRYTLKGGTDVSVDWGARAQMAGTGSDLKMKFYQVYLVGSAGIGSC